jgi:hypothetical protein
LTPRDWQLIDEMRGTASRGVFPSAALHRHVRRSAKRILPAADLIVSFGCSVSMASRAALVIFAVAARFFTTDDGQSH